MYYKGMNIESLQEEVKKLECSKKEVYKEMKEHSAIYNHYNYYYKALKNTNTYNPYREELLKSYKDNLRKYFKLIQKCRIKIDIFNEDIKRVEEQISGMISKQQHRDRVIKYCNTKAHYYIAYDCITDGNKSRNEFGGKIKPDGGLLCRKL